MATDIFEKMLSQMDITPRQQAVLRASMELFANQGFNQTSTRQIAQRAGVAEGTVYKQFKTKDEILAAIMRPIKEFLVPTVTTEFSQKILGGNPPELHEFIRSVFLDRLNLMAANHNFIRLALMLLIEHRDFMPGVVANVKKNVLVPFTKIIKHYQSQGQINPSLTPDTVLQLIISTLLSYGIQMALFDAHFDIEQAATTGAELVLHGISKRSP